jgi:ArsR family transcriptional regulator
MAISREELERFTPEDIDRMGERIIAAYTKRLKPAAPPELSNLDAAIIILRALSDPTRYQILRLVAQSENQQVTCADLLDAFDLAPPTLSHHMKELRGAGLVQGTRRGRTMHYKIVRRTTDEFLRFVAYDLSPKP